MKRYLVKIWRRVFGIGLLELMLALAIIAVMLVVAVKYYSSANSEQEAATLVNSFSTIKSAVENYLADNPTGGFPTMSLLVQSGYLPSLYGGAATKSGAPGTGSSVNEWGGKITLLAVGSLFSVQQTNVPGAVCNMAYGQLKETLNLSLGENIVVTGSGTSGGGTGSTKSKSKNGCVANSTITVTYVQ